MDWESSLKGSDAEVAFSSLSHWLTQSQGCTSGSGEAGWATPPEPLQRGVESSAGWGTPPVCQGMSKQTRKADTGPQGWHLSRKGNSNAMPDRKEPVPRVNGRHWVVPGQSLRRQSCRAQVGLSGRLHRTSRDLYRWGAGLVWEDGKSLEAGGHVMG